MTDSKSGTLGTGNLDSNVVFAVDTALPGKTSETAIIADITKDNAWIAIDSAAAAELDAWR
ncbi:DUF7556 family protein [Haladaptatus salinisoli]|uniref:DUF7556 family protein n=1 Tax=Haladaptatus salinisoli TaxID=2884876 RepID=UPI001D0AC171|nr:hypothetical protein [Haladaptatus salinisoli]